MVGSRFSRDSGIRDLSYLGLNFFEHLIVLLFGDLNIILGVLF